MRHHHRTDSAGRLCVALQPLADRLSWHLLQANTLHADVTPAAQLEPGRGKTRKAYLWAQRSNDLEARRPLSSSTTQAVAAVGMRGNF